MPWLSLPSDDRHVVTGSKDGTAKLWDAESGQINKTMKGHGKAVKSVESRE